MKMKLNFKQISKSITKFGKRIAPAASIIVGVGCTAMAAYKTAQAIPVAKQHIAEKKEELQKDKLTIVETVKACGQDFTEPFIFGVTGVAAVSAGVFDYEKTIKDLGATVGAASALLNEQAKEMRKAIGDNKVNEIQQNAINNVSPDLKGTGARIPTPGGVDIFIEDATGREFLSSEAWIRDSFAYFMDDFVDNPDDRPSLNMFYEYLAPNCKKACTPLGNYLTFPYDRDRPAKYNRVTLNFEPTETVDGKAAFKWKYSQPLEVFCQY